MLIGAKYVNDTASQGLLFTRPLCPYPKTARYNGSGDSTSASSFQCVDEHLSLDNNPGFSYVPMKISP